MEVEPGRKSLHNLMRFHGEVFVNPLFWTSYHLDLVGCRFVQVEAVVSSHDHYDVSQQDYEGQARAESKALKCEYAVMRLSRSCASLVKYYSFSNILVVMGNLFSRRSKGRAFFFAGRAVHRPEYQLFYRFNAPNQPLVGYLNYFDVNRNRRKHFQACPHPGRGNNAPVQRILQKRMSRIMPSEWTEDPYLVCILLSIAQLQKRKADSSQSGIYTPRLVVVSPSDTEFIHLYEAQVTLELLMALDSPTTATASTDWPIIKRKRIPFKPFEDFGVRIVNELLAPDPL